MRLLSVDARVSGRDRDALAALIEKHRPDVACVHNGPSLLRWRSISAALARKAGLVVVGGGRTGGANLILSTLGVDEVGTHDVRFGAGPRPAGAALAVLRLRGSEFLLAAARLSAAQDEAELDRAVTGLVPGNRPVIICVHGAARTPIAGRVAVAGGVQVDRRIAVEGTERDGAATLLELRLPQQRRRT